jgi:hypothetical protein
VGNLWRIGTDDGSWNTVLDNVDAATGKAQFAGPGGWNDPCMLNSRDAQDHPLLTELQIRAQFSLWSVFAAPLIISGSILKMSPETLATYTNTEVIAVDQDALGSGGVRLAGGDVSPIEKGLQFNGPAAIAAPCQPNRPAQNWSFGTFGGFVNRMRNGGAADCTKAYACNCTNVAGGSPTGVLDVEGYCGTGNPKPDGNLGFRMDPSGSGRLQSDNNEKVHTWSSCVLVRPSDRWVQMGPCAPGPPPPWAAADTRWAHDKATGQLRPSGTGIPDGLCLDWADHKLIPRQVGVVYGRRLADGGAAMVLINLASTTLTLGCNATCLAGVGLTEPAAPLRVRDLWLRADLHGPFTAGRGIPPAPLRPDGGHRMLRIWPIEPT